MTFGDPYAIDHSRRDIAPGVSPLFAERWSPRAFRNVEIPADILTAIFDAARWSPSCFNDQPWIFVTSTDEASFDRYLGLIVEGNRTWARHASVLGFAIARRHFAHNDTPNDWAAFDTGAAWMAMTLQARQYGLYTHGMGGIHKDAVYNQLDINREKYEVLCGFAIGALDVPDTLPRDLREREVLSQRNPLTNMWNPTDLS
ncbi:MAG: nitroreductase family protein [Cyanobacteria bacterium J06597_1]